MNVRLLPLVFFQFFNTQKHRHPDILIFMIHIDDNFRNICDQRQTAHKKKTDIGQDRGGHDI